MHTRLRFTFLLVLICASIQETPAQELWKLVAQSHVIVVGTPTVPIDKIEAAQQTRKHDYINVPVRVENCLKGDPCSGAINVRYFTAPVSYHPGPRALVESNGHRSVLFLVRVDEEAMPGIYFAGYTPKALQRYSEKLVHQLDAEVLAQKRIVSEFGGLFARRMSLPIQRYRP